MGPGLILFLVAVGFFGFQLVVAATSNHMENKYKTFNLFDRKDAGMSRAQQEANM